MTRTEFSAWCKTVHLLDGATGSMLRRAGMPAGVCSETWILDHPQTLIALQRAYLAAGSEIIYAPTFGANRVLLGHHDLQREVRALNRDLVQLGREAVGTSALLAGDMTTTGRPVTPGDDSAYETLLEIYREQAEALLEAGVDLFAVETMMGVTECMAAIEAIRSLCETPILCTLSVYSDGKCYFDGSAEEAAELSAGALFMQGVATSIDALSVGFTISEYGWLMALVASLIIAAVTFFICMAGLRIGKKFGTQLSGKANILGGVILIGIGLEIFISGVF